MRIWAAVSSVRQRSSSRISEVFDRRTRITPVTVDGRQGYFISGAEHVFLVAPNDLIQESRVRLARDVLVWEHGNLTLRIEGELTLREALKIAKSFR